MFPKAARRATLFALFCLSSSAVAQQVASPHNQAAWGTPSASGSRLGIDARMAAPASNADLGRIAPTRVFRGASLGTGAVGLRNRGGGGLEVSGVSGRIKAAFLYWAVITEGAPNDAVSGLFLRRGNGGPFTRIGGRAVGTGSSPCWLGDRITVFRGDVPLALATGNDRYSIEVLKGGNGRRDGEDPWVSSPPPLMEGASLVLIGSGQKTVGIYDSKLAGRSFYPRLSYQLELPVSAQGATKVVLHNIGADGQVGRSTNALGETPREVTSIGSPPRPIAGPGSRINDSDWNGAIAGPLPQLWDNTGHEITPEVKAASITRLLPISVSAPDDCLTPVANIISIE